MGSPEERRGSRKTQDKAPANEARAGAKKERPLSPEDRYKLRIADELGLGEKVRRVGWGGLSAAETGRIGGHMTRKARTEAGDEKPHP